MLLHSCLLGLLLAVMAIYTSDIQARPPIQNPILVVVCYTPQSCLSPRPPNDSEIITLDRYTGQVLANEWPAQANMDALKAGAVAIRTFSYRSPGCGAHVNNYMEGVRTYRVLNNGAQAYRYGGRLGPQQAVTDSHTDAESETRNVILRRSSDNATACAKYDANAGDPTQACSSAECPDARDQDTLPEVPDPVSNRVGSRISTGMSQNGSAAWAEGNNPWDSRQELSHYYYEVLIANSHPEYRWVWLDVGEEIVFTSYGGEQYYGPTFNVPDSMEAGQSYAFSLHLQNTSIVKWRDSGSTRTQIALYWNGDRNSAYFFDLDEEIDPGEDDRVMVSARPPSAGTHCLTVDLVRNGLWFSDQSSPAWPVLRKCISVRAPDTTPPSNPNNQNGSHDDNRWSNDNTIHIEWRGAADDRTSAADLVYSIEWTTSPTTIPNTGVNETEAETTSPPLADGRWQLHVRTRDAAGNWSSGAAHFGPFLIDTASPVGFHQAPRWSPTAAFTLTWRGSDTGGLDNAGSGLAFDFDYHLNSDDYQDLFEKTGEAGSAVYDKGAKPDDRVSIRACLQDGAGNPARPNPCSYSVTQFRTTPYLFVSPAALSCCFVQTDTVPLTGTLSINNEGPGTLDWTAAISHPYLTLFPTSGSGVSPDFPDTAVYTVTHPALLGDYRGVITISSPTAGVSNSPATIPAQVRVVPTAEDCIFDTYLPLLRK